jgi:undecaprenyl-diphosphatase
MSARTINGVHFFQAVSNTAGTISIAVPALIAIRGFIDHDSHTKLDAVFVFESLGISFLITEGLKYSINRERPFKTLPGVTAASDAGGPSFPSGHSSNAFAMATSLCILYPKWYVIAPSLLWAGTVGYSRIYLGVHYPSDVLAGAIVGAGSAYIAYKLNKILFRSKSNLRKNLQAIR